MTNSKYNWDQYIINDQGMWQMLKEWNFYKIDWSAFNKTVVQRSAVASRFVRTTFYLQFGKLFRLFNFRRDLPKTIRNLYALQPGMSESLNFLVIPIPIPPLVIPIPSSQILVIPIPIPPKTSNALFSLYTV